MYKHFSKYGIDKKKRFFGSWKCDLSYFFDLNATPSILIFFWLKIFMRPLISHLCIFFASQHFSNLRSVKSFFVKKTFVAFFVTNILFFVKQKFYKKKPYI